MNRTKVAVTGTGSLIGQAIIKCIQKSGLKELVDITGLDYFESTVGSYWCARNYILPDLLKEQNPGPWKEKIFSVIKNEGIELLFIGVDFELPHFADLKEELEEKTSCRVLVSNKRVIEIANDKYLTYQFLKENDLYYPETFLPEELQNRTLQFPYIIKPRVGARSRDVYLLHSQKDLDEKIRMIKDPVIQEAVGNDQTEYTCGVICVDDEVREVIALRRSLKEGNTFKAEFSFAFPEVVGNYVKKVASKLNPLGACNFQLRLDKNGIPKIFEINARHSGTTFIRSLFGWNEVEYLIRYFRNEPMDSFKLSEGEVVRFFDEFYIPFAGKI
jgi:carbamoyl-phosphate synthase large subunit